MRAVVRGRGVHLKDLILLHTALPDWLDDDYVNFRKMAQLSLIFAELTQVQNSATLPIEPNMDLVNTVRVSLRLYSQPTTYRSYITTSHISVMTHQ